MPKTLRKPRKRPGRFDPTRTGLLRRTMTSALRTRFLNLKMELVKLFTQEDAFGYKVKIANAFCPTGPGGGVDPSCGKEGGGGSDHTAHVNKFGKTISSYAGSGHYIKVNEMLRLKPAALLNARQPANEYTKGSALRTAVDLQTIIQTAPPVAESVVHRGLNEKIGKQILKEAKVGKDITLDGFQSTSVDKGVAEDFAHKVVLRIHEPKGLALGHLSYAGQQEILLPHRASYRVEHITDEGDKTVVTLRQLNRGQKVGGGLGQPITVNIRWALEPESEQLKRFKVWLKQQLRSSVVNASMEDLWKRFHTEAYIKGAGRSFDDDKGPKDFNRDEFLRTSFGQRMAPEKVNLMAARSFSDLEGITDKMSVDMVKILTKGFEAGNNPRNIARELAKQVDIGLQRATTIARTEVIAAHAQGQLNALRALGVEKVGVMVEWSTAGDDRVCELCANMEGAIYTIDEAEGKIPAHPNCRCAFIPARVGEAETDNALHTFERLWNAFCPTGPGGGVDATCGKGGGGPIAKMDKWQASSLAVEARSLLEKGKSISADDIAALPLHIKQFAKLGGNSESLVKGLLGHKHPQQAEITATLLKAKLVDKKDVPDVTPVAHTAPPASRPALSANEKNAITEYTDTPMHEHLNTALWSGSSGAGITTHEHLQTAFQKVKTFKAVDVYRGIDIRDKDTVDKYIRAAQQAQSSGSTLTLPGYQSTSTGKPQIKGNVQLKIKAIRGLDAQPYTKKWKDENELLLNHNSKFKVKSVANKGGTWHLEMEQQS